MVKYFYTDQCLFSLEIQIKVRKYFSKFYASRLNAPKFENRICVIGIIGRGHFFLFSKSTMENYKRIWDQFVNLSVYQIQNDWEVCDHP